MHRRLHILLCVSLGLALCLARCTCGDGAQGGDDGEGGGGSGVGGWTPGESECAKRCLNLPHASAACTEDACVVARCDEGYGDCDGDPMTGCEARLDADVNHCGSCTTLCAYVHGQGECAAGSCSLATCEAGWLDIDGDPATGCEYACAPTNGGEEIKDGADNDCNGLVDDVCRFDPVDEPRKIDLAVEDATFLQVFWMNGRYHAVWRETVGGRREVVTGSFNPDGTPWGARVQVSHGVSGDVANPAFVYAEGRYGFAWIDTRDGGPAIWFSALDESGGVVVAERMVHGEGKAKLPNLQWDWIHGRYVLLWFDDSTGDDEIYLTFVGTDGTRAPGATAVSGYAGASRGPGLKILEDAIYVAWVEQLPGRYKVYFVKVGHDRVRDATDLLVHEAPGTANGVSIDWDGTWFGLSWDGMHAGHYAVYFQRVKPDLTLELDAPRRMSNALFDAKTPSMWWNGTFYALVWRDGASAVPQVVMTLLDVQGHVSRDQFTVSKAVRDVEGPVALWNGSEFGVMWLQATQGYVREIWFRRVGCVPRY